MNANLAVIADNPITCCGDGWRTAFPGGVALTLMMAIGAAALALPLGILLAGAAPGAMAGWCADCCSCGPS